MSGRSPGIGPESISGPFVALLGIIVLAPLPMGGATIWALGLIGTAVMAVLIWHLWAPDSATAAGEIPSRPRRPWQRAWVLLTLMAAWAGLLAFQLLPLPASWVSALDLSPADGFPVILGGWATLSVDPYSTRLYFFKALVLLAFFSLLLRLATTPRRVELLVKTVVLCGFVQATIGIVLFALGARYSLFFGEVEHSIAKGTFVNRNHFAGYLEMALAVGIGLMIAKLDNERARTWRQRLRAWLALLMSDKARLRIMLIVMVIGLIASRSRMGNGAFFLALLIAGIIAIALSRQATRSTVVFLVSIVVLDIVVMGSVIGVDKVMQRIEETNLRDRPPPEPSAPASGGLAAQVAQYKVESLEARLRVARLSTAIIRDFPVLGAGGGTYEIAFRPYQPLAIVGKFKHAHSDFVEFATETGVVGFALLAAMVALSLGRALRILVVRRDQFARGMAFGSLMGIVVLMLHSVVDFNLQLPANAMMFMVILALPYLVVSRSGSNSAHAS